MMRIFCFLLDMAARGGVLILSEVMGGWRGFLMAFCVLAVFTMSNVPLWAEGDGW